MTTPTRILLLGDTHSNANSTLVAIDYAAEVGADLILQLGDFGFWPREPGGLRFLREVEKRLDQRGLMLDWVDGNHEDFERLLALPIGGDGRRQISDHVWHLPRGHRWTWGDTTWVAVGGAVSVDKNYRADGTTWFAAEELTDDQVDAIVAAGQSDVVVSHDAPLGVPLLRRLLRQDRPAWRRESEWPTGLLVRSDEHQRRVRRVVDGVQARRVFHGHHHLMYGDDLATLHGIVEVCGVGMDTDPLERRTVLVDAAGHPILEE